MGDNQKKRYYIWGRSSCDYCIRACEFLYSRNELYDFFDHDGDEPFLEELKGFYEHETVPLIVENDISTGLTKFVGGYDDLQKFFIRYDIDKEKEND